MFKRGFVVGVVFGLGGYAVITVMRYAPAAAGDTAAADGSLTIHYPTASQSPVPQVFFHGRMQQEQHWVDQLGLAVAPD